MKRTLQKRKHIFQYLWFCARLASLILCDVGRFRRGLVQLSIDVCVSRTGVLARTRNDRYSHAHMRNNTFCVPSGEINYNPGAKESDTGRMRLGEDGERGGGINMGRKKMKGGEG